ncbi:hypothetical protein RA273_28405, partial [Pseudomonas syringae pv. tagetis]
MAESVLLVTPNTESPIGQLPRMLSFSKTALENGQVTPEPHAADPVDLDATGTQLTPDHRVPIYHPQHPLRLAA